jgi:predicted component of type VI protein secretion system
VKVRGFKIAAAREILTKNRQGVQKTADALQKLIELREDLQVLKSHLDAL